MIGSSRFLLRGKATSTTSSSASGRAKDIEKFSRYRPTPLSIQRFLDFGRNFTPESSYKFLQLELPVRLAGILKELAFLPSELQSLPHCQEIHAQYVASLDDILRFENHPPERIDEFTAVLQQVYRRHADTVTTMAQAVLTVKENYLSSGPAASFNKLPKFERNIQYFLNRLYMSRISTRMLINQHILFCDRETRPISDTELVGTIDPYCDIIEVLDQAYKDARFLCEQYYMNAPEMLVTAKDELSPTQGGKMEIVYVPSHLYHILFELLKNAMRATVENAENQSTYDLPPIVVTVVRSKEDVSIKLSDQGGGIPRRLRDKIFHYLYTTADNPVLSTSSEEPLSAGGVPLAGYGYGLPLSRLYARYFAGDLQIYSCDGYGTDALVYLQTESELARENLPIYNETGSRKIYEAHLTPNDWTVE